MPALVDPVCRACRPLIVRLLMGAVLCVPPLHAATDKPGSGPRKPGKVTFIDAPSGETPAAREKRLKRECQGRPNAGMCLGHTR